MKIEKNEQTQQQSTEKSEQIAAPDIGAKRRGRSIAAELAKCAIFVVLMVVAAKISIPFYPVALTFQTVVAVLAGLLLGPKYGSAAMAVYVFIGLVGLPVFTSGGGFAYVVQVTFGYTIGFIAAAFAAGLAAGKGALSLRRAVIAGLVGFFVNYLVGIPYFACIWAFYLHNGGLWQIIVTGNLLYMPKDLVLCILAAFLAWRVRPLLGRLSA